MATELQERKLDKAFGHLDADRSGYVEEGDLTALGVRLLNHFDMPLDSAKAQRIATGFGTFWQRLAASLDTDGDKKLSPHEWRSGMTRAYIEDGDAFDAHFVPGAMAVLELADTDDDGKVSRTEFITMQRAFGTIDDEADLAFGKLDRDGDGYLSLDELIRAVREFYIGADENAVGNWFFGNV
jgi:Ca2+-binding EF-hand superfamily protein